MWIRAGTTLVLAVCALAFSACEAPPQLPPQRPSLNVIVLPGPTTWFMGPSGTPEGIDHDLLTRFAAERGLALKVSFANDAVSLMNGVARGNAQLGAGGLLRPVADGGDWTRGYQSTDLVVIYNTDRTRPADWAALDGTSVAYRGHTGVGAALGNVIGAHPAIFWKPVRFASSDALIGEVADGTLDYAVVPAIDAAAARNVHLDFDVAFTASSKQQFAWVIAPGQLGLREALDAFVARSHRDGLLTRLVDRYRAVASGLARLDASVFQDRIRGSLAQWRRNFQDAQAQSGIGWRLLAAVAYQESQWDPLATSETGVRGLMQLTADTAKHLGVVDRLDPRNATLAAARYLADLKQRLPARIAEPDRTWFALAAYNIGMGHLEDARVLAQRMKLNPDLWSDVRRTLPLLADPKYYLGARNGYARGGMPIAFVERVRSYYDILLRTERARPPLLQMILALR
ncbi:MAG: membrane-bound lytic murein transglycosylase MltF [Casimicrobiaceae bacterium]